MIDSDNVFDLHPGLECRQARKTASTEVIGPIHFLVAQDVATTDGVVRVEPGTYYLALDARGNPYPIEVSVFEETYEFAE